MLSLIVFASLAVSQVYGAALPRTNARLSRRRCHAYDSVNNEDQNVFQARYAQLNCNDYKQATSDDQRTFFNSCCKPLKKDQSVTDLPALCGLSAPANVAPVPVTPAPQPQPEPAPAPQPEPAPAPQPEPAPAPQPQPQPQPAPPSNPAGSLSGSGTATYYYQNGVAGSCGTVHSDNDYIVAMADQPYNAHCGKTVVITNTQNGRTISATVADTCPTCDSSQSIDLSSGLFAAFTDGNFGQGVFPITWTLQN